MDNSNQTETDPNQQFCSQLKQDNLTERGLLDLSVALSTRDITAGKDFALFVLIRNPFEREAWIRQVDVSLPDELKVSHKSYASDEDDRRLKDDSKNKENETPKLKEDNNLELEKLITQISNLETKFSDVNSESSETSKQFLSQLDLLSKELLKNINELRRLQDEDGNQTYLNIDGQNSGAVKVFTKQSYLNLSGINQGLIEFYDSRFVEEEKSKSGKISLVGSLPLENALQPGCTTVYTAVLTVDRDFFFTPSQYRLQFNVQYSFSGKRKSKIKGLDEIVDKVFSNTISHEISIRPSVRSMLFGAAGGGAIGAVSRVFQVTPSADIQQFGARDYINAGISVVPAVILSCVAIIFMARKSDAQSFISVEDFWGGILIGFLVGYTGTSFFQQLTGFTPDMEVTPETSISVPAIPIQE